MDFWLDQVGFLFFRVEIVVAVALKQHTGSQGSMEQSMAVAGADQAAHLQSSLTEPRKMLLCLLVATSFLGFWRLSTTLERLHPSVDKRLAAWHLPLAVLYPALISLQITAWCMLWRKREGGQKHSPSIRGVHGVHMCMKHGSGWCMQVVLPSYVPPLFHSQNPQRRETSPFTPASYPSRAHEPIWPFSTVRMKKKPHFTVLYN